MSMSPMRLAGATSGTARRGVLPVEIRFADRVMLRSLFVARPDNVIVWQIEIDGIRQMVDGVRAAVLAPGTTFSECFRGFACTRLTVRVQRTRVAQRPVYVRHPRRHRAPTLMFRTIGNCTPRRGGIAVAVQCTTFAGDGLHERCVP